MQGFFFLGMASGTIFPRCENGFAHLIRPQSWDLFLSDLEDFNDLYLWKVNTTIEINFRLNSSSQLSIPDLYKFFS